MKRIALFLAMTVVLLSLGACKNNERMLSRYSLTDTAHNVVDATLNEFVWNDGVLQMVRVNNPFVAERPEYEDYCAIFNYDLNYEYENGILRTVKGNKYHSVFTFEGDKLVRVDQYSNDGVHAFQTNFNYLDSGIVKATYYAMSREAFMWLESNLYPRKDSTGAMLHYDMPDTSLHLLAEGTYQWNDGNLVYSKASFEGGTFVESWMEYDNKINPFYNTYCEFDKMDVLSVSLSWADNNLGVSKNNLQKITVQMDGLGADAAQPVVEENTYEYEGDYPVVRRNSKNAVEYHYEYVK